ncbi:bifunctional folylpolyglutamate synthase/dihydrofolate synthase [Geminicoccus roseus]|uniref:bifunctional folylpolyglutamate synthase/dihydrofolate synthase n=1 Tax=Geminicoccus roseus TaxID=404900 RepID=UPI000413F813|nr:folylpolyglutamate synthase/dihydrofolate synthase family protein [Geminicoccus roseus]
MSSPSSDEILARLIDLHPKKIDLSLARMEQILAELGHPERKVPPVIHLAGTNGKGSTGACIAAALAAQGQRVHRYISPHLVRFNERIMLDNRPIDEARLTELLEEVERINAGRPITFFEITTAMAFLAFARFPGDALVLEVGMGGRLDATNVVDRPAVSIITPVFLDHETYLGGTIDLIATEKAGILKPGVPCVVAPQDPEGLRAIERRAAMLDTPLLVHGRDWWFEQHPEALIVEDNGERLELPRPALDGPHQYANAATAVVALRRLPPKLCPGPAALAAGVSRASWPGRWQRLWSGPMTDLLPPGWELRLDGGHNPAAALALAATLDMLPPRPLHLVVGMLNTKDASAFLAPLLARASTCTMVPIPDEPLSRPPEELAAAAAELGHPARQAAHHVDAVRAIVALSSDEPSLILVCGSLHFAGVVLADHG